MNIEEFSEDKDIADVARFGIRDRVECTGGFFGTVVDHVERGGRIKYRVDVDGRGDSFVFFGHELKAAA